MCLEFQILCSPMKTCLIAKLQAIPQFLDKAKLGHMLYPLVMTFTVRHGFSMAHKKIDGLQYLLTTIAIY